MFDQAKLRWKERQLHKSYQPRLEEAKAVGDRTKFDYLDKEYAYARACLSDDRRLLYQRRLIGEAHRLFIPVPPYTGEDSEYWETSGIAYRDHFLTEKAIRNLREEIRRERRERQERLIPWLAPLTGLVGALAGLLAVLFLLATVGR